MVEKMSTNYPIECRQITKVYKRNRWKDLLRVSENSFVTALDKVSLTVNEFEILGLLGPNGAGKTTLIKILSTLLIPTQGYAMIYGNDTVRNEAKVKRLIGLVNSDERSFYWRLTGKQNLMFYAALHDLPQKEAKVWIHELLEMLDLNRFADEYFYTYSTGMKQKLAIARGLLNKPKVLFMDEPTRSLDPVSAKAVRDFIRDNVTKITGGTVILATHQLYEAEQLCHRVAVIDKGKIAAIGTIEELKKIFQKFQHYQFTVRNADGRLLDDLRRMEGVMDVKSHTGSGDLNLDIYMNDQDLSFHKIIRKIVDDKSQIIDCRRDEPSLEEVFHLIIKRG